MTHGIRLPAAALLAFAPILAPPPRAAAADRAAEVASHVEDVARRVAAHVASADPAPRVVIVERAALALVRTRDGRLEATTGLLSVVGSDAELAMVVGHALAAPSAGASGGTGRRTRSARRADADAAARAVRALVAAGYDGDAALRAWDVLTAASPFGEIAGSLEDRRANARRERSAAAALRKLAPNAAGVIGKGTYREQVLAHLNGRVFARVDAGGIAPTSPTGPPAPAEPPRRGGASPPPPPSTPGERSPPPEAAAWVIYTRSGGITGWTETVSIGRGGAVTSSGSGANERDGSRAHAPLTGAELVGLRTRLDVALAEPERRATPEAPYLRDGQVRVVTITEAGATRTLSLSDGLLLSAEDHDLVRVLEALLRRP